MNSIEKTLAVLRALSAPGQPHRLADIAAGAEVGKTTGHRILQTLVANNYAQARGDGMYAAGPALIALGRTSSDADLVSIAQPTLVALQQRTGHTVHLAVRTGRVAVYVAKVEGDKPYQMASRVGMQIPLHCTAIGKSVLAELAPGDLESVLMPAEPGDRPTLGRAGLRRLGDELARVRDDGYAVDDGENEPNVRCIGAAIHDADGRVIGGVSISSLAVILSLDGLVALAPEVLATAEQISSALGYVTGARTA